jgi:hypothetical protein
MWTQERIMLALTIAVLIIALVIQATHHAKFTLVTAGVLVIVIVVRVIMPVAKSLREPKKPDQG